MNNLDMKDILAKLMVESIFSNNKKESCNRRSNREISCTCRNNNSSCMSNFHNCCSTTNTNTNCMCSADNDRFVVLSPNISLQSPENTNTNDMLKISSVLNNLNCNIEKLVEQKNQLAISNNELIKYISTLNSSSTNCTQVPIVTTTCNTVPVVEDTCKVNTRRKIVTCIGSTRMDNIAIKIENIILNNTCSKIAYYYNTDEILMLVKYLLNLSDSIPRIRHNNNEIVEIVKNNLVNSDIVILEISSQICDKDEQNIKQIKELLKKDIVIITPLENTEYIKIDDNTHTKLYEIISNLQN